MILETVELDNTTGDKLFDLTYDRKMFGFNLSSATIACDSMFGMDSMYGGVEDLSYYGEMLCESDDGNLETVTACEDILNLVSSYVAVAFDKLCGPTGKCYESPESTDFCVAESVEEEQKVSMQCDDEDHKKDCKVSITIVDVENNDEALNGDGNILDAKGGSDVSDSGNADLKIYVSINDVAVGENMGMNRGLFRQCFKAMGVQIVRPMDGI